MRPVSERTPAGDHLFCQELGYAFIWCCVELCALQDKISKEEISFLLNAPGDRIKENLVQRPEIVRKKLAKLFFTDARDWGEQNNRSSLRPWISRISPATNSG